MAKDERRRSWLDGARGGASEREETVAVVATSTVASAAERERERERMMSRVVVSTVVEHIFIKTALERAACVIMNANC